MQDETFADLLRLYETAEVSFRSNTAAFGMLDISLRMADMKTQQSKKELAVAAKLEKAVQAFHVAFCSWRGIWRCSWRGAAENFLALRTE